jgi:iron transport multicopper oxidase
VVDSAQFGQLWKVAFNAKEQFYAKPLVFTPASTGVQILFLASSQNNIRTLNAKTGAVLNTRLVHPPFLQSDIGCTDIPNTIGIIGTPIIDPKTEIAYFFSKTYIPNYRVPGNTGTANGVYYFHGVSLDTLQDVPGYPILIDGSVADNEPLDSFIGGVILQRPALVQVGNYVYGGFGGHCDLFNYTGVVIGIDIVNKNIATQWAAVVGPQAPHQSTYLQGSNGGGGGIWQSGVGLSTDGNRLFLATGNGNAHQNDGKLQHQHVTQFLTPS